MYEFFLHTIDVKTLDRDKHYTCRHCGKIINKKYIVEVIVHHNNAVDDRAYLCQSCYKPFVSSTVERGC